MGFWSRGDSAYDGVSQDNFALPGADQRSRRLNGLMGTQAPQSNDPQLQADQRQLATTLRSRMNGADSLSRMQLQRDTGANIGTQQALMSSGRPGDAAYGARMASNNAGKIATGLSGNAALAGNQERESAGNQLQGALGQQQQNNQFNTGAQLQQQGINQGWSAQDLASAQAQQQGNQAYEGNRTARYGTSMSEPSGAEKIGGALIGGAGAVAAFLKDGGVVTKPTNAVIGEAGPEAVIPLKKLPGIMNKMSGGLMGGQAESATPALPTMAQATSKIMELHERMKKLEAAKAAKK